MQACCSRYQLSFRLKPRAYLINRQVFCGTEAIRACEAAVTTATFLNGVERPWEEICCDVVCWAANSYFYIPTRAAYAQMPMSPCATSRFMPLCWQKRVLQLVSRHHTRTHTHVIPDSDKDVPSAHNSNQPFAVIHMLDWRHCCISGLSPSDKTRSSWSVAGGKKNLFVFRMFIPLFCSYTCPCSHLQQLTKQRGEKWSYKKVPLQMAQMRQKKPQFSFLHMKTTGFFFFYSLSVPSPSHPTVL